MLKINDKNKFEVQFKEAIERVRSLPNYHKIEKIAQSWVNDRRKGGLSAMLAYQRIKFFIGLEEQSLIEYLRKL